ncbi:MAG: glycosyltransferase family 4 protein [Oligoflexia bacterium]|nr:glycosyltransferase family 4 protein [Oligoflexia bacterium]
MRITFFIEGSSVPASRFRVIQFLPRLMADGAKVRVLSTYPNKFLTPPVPLSEPLRLLWMAFALPFVVLQRLVQILIYSRISDVIVLQRDLLYRIPWPFLESILFTYTQDLRARGRLRVVFDVDDAIFCNKQGLASVSAERKLAYILSGCRSVITGNKFLQQYFGALVPNECQLQVIPTVVDTERGYRKGNLKIDKSEMTAIRGAPRPLTIGWTGLSSNLRELSAIAGVLARLKARYGIRVLLISNAAPLEPELQGFELVRWSQRHELEQLGQIDIGIMPLADTVWSRGKCGFKLIQYMALGLPVVASPVGVNTEIVQDGKNGFLASTPEQWEVALERLIQSPQLRQELGTAGRARIVEHYSVSSVYPTWRAEIVGS